MYVRTIENSWKNKKQISNSLRVFLEQNKKQDYVEFDGVSYKSYCVYLFGISALVGAPSKAKPKNT